MAIGLTAVAALTLSACSNEDATVATPPGSDQGSSGTTTEIDAAHNDADVTFINDMTPHHSGALAMAELAPTRAESPEVKALASKIADAQGPEIETMAVLAQAWGVEIESSSAMGHSMGGSSSVDMSMEDDTAALEPLTGAGFDEEFLTRMIAHHEGALPMAQAELADGQNQQAKALAQEIVDTQTAEIAEMKRLLAAA